MASTANVRQGKNARNFQNPANHTNRTKVKWNTQHQVNMPPRNQSMSPLQQQPPTPSATNHINAPSISSGPNTLKPFEVPIHDEVSAKHMHDRMLCLLANFVGMNVQVTVKNGIKYEGLFHTATTEGELGVVLKLARKVLTKAEEKTVAVNKVYKSIIINPKDCMAIEATGVDFSSSEKNFTTEREAGFRTDTDISGRAEIRERELRKWTPDEHGGGEVLGGLEDDCIPETGNGTAWDQFAANEQLFGLKTDFDEEIYTTKLDRSRADFKEREKQAIQIANEITRTQTTNVHMLEERGYLVEDSHMDEEDRYGAVVRNRDPSKYMPPALRKMQEQQNATTCKKPEPAKEPAKEDKSKPAPEAKSITASASVQPNLPIPKIQTFNQQPSLAQYRIPSDVTQLFNSHTQRKPGIDAHGKPIEAQIMNTFKQFASNEKERLQQRKQAIFKKEMHGKVAELAEWGKTFKLNSPLPSDLIPILTKDEGKRQQLAAKSASVSTVTNEKDAKNKEKDKQQKEVVKEKEKERTKEKEKPKIIIADTSDAKAETKKSESKIEEKSKSNSEPVETKSTLDKATPDKSPTHQSDKSPSIFPPNRTPASTPNSQFKLNAKASEWRPNPNAATFTPTTPTSTADKRSPGSSPFFGNKQLKKSPVSLKDSFSPFQKKPLPNPSTIPPTWPFGQRPFRHQFTVTTPFEEDMYTQAVSPGYGFAPYPVGPPFRFPAAQYVGVPPITMQQTAPMPYMQPGFPSMPFTTPPLPAAGAPPAMYSPQIPSVMPPQPFNAQGFPSPGRSHMVPGIHPQMYAAYQNPHTMPLMRYPHESMPIHVPPNGVMIGQRPMMIDPHYAQPEGAPMEGIPVSEPATTQ